MNGPAQRYSLTAIGLHWVIALLIFIGFGIGWVMTDIPGLTPTKLRYYNWHKWIGVTVFALACVRVIWRLTHRPPPMPPMPRWQHVGATLGHALLYVLMIVIPLSGYLYSYAAGVPVVYFGLIKLPAIIGPSPEYKDLFKSIHIALNYTLAVLVFIHIIAALEHQLIRRDSLLARMLPGRTKETPL